MPLSRVRSRRWRLTFRDKSQSLGAGPAAEPRSSPLAVFLVFLRLGLTSFGGPIAHLGYFRAEFVERRRWLDDRRFTDLVALCQFLPGPASSQVGLAVGLYRAGWLGGFAAWAGFTLPSACLLIGFAVGIAHYGEIAGSGAVHGLMVAAVAIVAQAVWGMAKSLCPDRQRAAIAVLAALITLAMPSALGQIVAIIGAGFIGWRCLPGAPAPVEQAQFCAVSRRAGAVALALFGALLIGLPLAAALTGSPLVHVVDGFYRAGALVFGGGHVVLPLLHAVVVPAGLVGDSEFIAGYGAAQAVPGPLFTFAAFLGASMRGPVSGWLGGFACLLVIFLPAVLLVVGGLPFWDALRRRAGVQSTMAGINACVVGILLAALYDPVWTSGVRSRSDFGLALSTFALLVYGRMSPVIVVVGAAVCGWLLQMH